MKLIGAIFLTISVSILLIGGLAAVQHQSDLGDTVIDNTSDNYDQYQELKNNTELSFSFLSYTPLLLMIFLMVVAGAFMIGAVALIRN